MARFSGPEKRHLLAHPIQPMTGNLMRLPSARNVPALLAAQKDGSSSLRLNRGYLPRFSKNARNAVPRSMIASCTAPC